MPTVEFRSTSLEIEGRRNFGIRGRRQLLFQSTVPLLRMKNAAISEEGDADSLDINLLILILKDTATSD